MKKRMKGFTLMELLAVLVVLAIIALITIPVVINVIDDSKERSYENSVNSYGKAVEQAIATYKMLHPGDKLPEYISEYKVETSGNTVKCEDYIQNVNANIFLQDCHVYNDQGKMISKKNYTYPMATKLDGEFKAGEFVYAKGVKFLVYKDTPKEQDYITVIKASPLSVSEVNRYGAGVINRFKGNKAFVDDDIGLIAYLDSEGCKHDEGYACTTDYNQSDIKKVVDKWADDVFGEKSLVEVDGYKARLITYDELVNDVKYAEGNTSSWVYAKSAPQETQWIYGNYSYWTMSSYYDSNNRLWFISHDHLISAGIGNNGGNIGAVRPVVNIKKNKVQ